MWRKIVRHEWRLLRAEKLVWLLLFSFSATSLYALTNGWRHYRRQQRAVAEFKLVEELRLRELQERARRMEAILASGLRLEAMPKYQRYEFEYGPLDPRYAAAFGQQHAVLPVSPLSLLNIGQTDWQTPARIVSWYKPRTAATVTPTDNPQLQMAGHFDFAFLLVYLCPLLIIAWCYDLLAAEHEAGTLRMLLSHPVSLAQLLAGKVVLRLALIVGGVSCFTALGFALSGMNFRSGATWALFALWLAAIFAYVVFWTGLCVAVNLRSHSSATNALVCVGIWILLTLLAPRLGAWLPQRIFPLPSRAAYLDAQRRLARETEQIDEQALRNLFFRHHPRYDAAARYSEWAKRYGLTLIARETEAEARLRQQFGQYFDRQVNRQRQWAKRFEWVSPALALRQTLDVLAATGPERDQSFLAQAERYNRAWQDFFWPGFFADDPFHAADYDRIPRFHFEEISLKETARFAWPALQPLCALAMAAAIGCLPARRRRRGYRGGTEK